MAEKYNFADDLTAKVFKYGPLDVGMDPQPWMMPPHLIKIAMVMFPDDPIAQVGWVLEEFNRLVLEAIHGIVGVIKPQIAFYEEFGAVGLKAFTATVKLAKEMGFTVIEDAKRIDGGPTATAYIDGHLGKVPIFTGGVDQNGRAILGSMVGPMRVDCMTVAGGYIGPTFVDQFLKITEEYGTGGFFVTKTSFEPPSEIELIRTWEEGKKGPNKEENFGDLVWERQACLLQQWGEGTEGACGIRRIGPVIGATFPEEAAKMRIILPTAVFLIPGYGEQGAGPDEAVVGLRKDGSGGVINSSRGIISSWCAINAKTGAKGPYFTDSANFVTSIRRATIDSQRRLILAAQKADKWPHGMPHVLAA
ncbi:MAG: orotidine-5'-phosphate decarboxylase [Candidatus Pacebacteria bacterium]|nr:orotidine-5'-phosphate decarboxylase [Candidatus Paceibacterota bacterium]